MQKVLVIVGPTASGKSSLGVQLAKRFNGEVISADSRQVYKGLDIGTGKITKREMKGVPHHLLDVSSPKKVFSAGEFVKKGRRAIQDISKQNKLPIVVGGTGFYIDSLLGRISLPEVRPNTTLRAQLKKKTAGQLYTLLKRIDPKRAKTMDTPSERNNGVRLIRAIEIAKALGKSPMPSPSNSFDVLWLGIAPSDALLRKRIDARLAIRLKGGMIAEAKKLHREGLSYKRMEALGLEYRALARFLQKKIDRDGLQRELQSDIWRYAHKQKGYWKRNNAISWYKPIDKKMERRIRTWLEK